MMQVREISLAPTMTAPLHTSKNEKKNTMKKMETLPVGIMRGCQTIFMTMVMKASHGERIAKVYGLYVGITTALMMKIWRKFSMT